MNTKVKELSTHELQLVYGGNNCGPMGPMGDYFPRKGAMDAADFFWGFIYGLIVS